MPFTDIPFREVMSAKHPLVSRDYFLNGDKLLQTGVTILSVAITPLPDDITVGVPVVQTPSGRIVKVRVSGGTSGTDYDLTFVLSLSDGETEVAIMTIPVRSTSP